MISPLTIINSSPDSPGSSDQSPALDEVGQIPEHVRLAIIGAGPAGLTAALYAARADLAPLVLAGSAPGGQLTLTTTVENYPGFPDGIEGPALIAAMRAQAIRFGARVLDSVLRQVDLSSRPFILYVDDRTFTVDALIVATGAQARWLGLPSEARLRGHGVSSCATCDGFFFRGVRLAVVGGGDTALEEALFLTRFASSVEVLVRRDHLRASKILAARAQADPKIELHLGVEVVEVLGESVVSGVRLRDTASGQLSELALEGLFVAIGHDPDTELFAGSLARDEAGYLCVGANSRTSLEGVFAAGDVHDQRYRQAVTAAGDGAQAAIDAERWLAQLPGLGSDHE
jgi:thioredoxin reductase (NADPH)